MRSDRAPTNRDEDSVRANSTRDETDMRTTTPVQQAELTKPDLRREATNVMVVGPPGCCGCVNQPVRVAAQGVKQD